MPTDWPINFWSANKIVNIREDQIVFFQTTHSTRKCNQSTVSSFVGKDQEVIYSLTLTNCCRTNTCARWCELIKLGDFFLMCLGYRWPPEIIFYLTRNDEPSIVIQLTIIRSHFFGFVLSLLLVYSSYSTLFSRILSSLSNDVCALWKINSLQINITHSYICLWEYSHKRSFLDSFNWLKTKILTSIIHLNTVWALNTIY